MLKALSDQQSSTIEEVINIGLGRAAMTLSSIVADEILLNASNIHLSNINTGQAFDLIKKSTAGNVVSVSQDVFGDIETLALVVFSEADATEIVHRMILRNAPVEVATDYESDVMCEVGNIILNASMSALSSMMYLSLESYLPVHHMGDCETVTLDSAMKPLKILINLDFIIAQKPIRGFITFSLSAKSLQKILQSVEQYSESEHFEWLN